MPSISASPTASFDVIVAQYVITAVPDPEATLDEFARVLKPGGEIVLVNHIGAETGLRRAFEQWFAPVARRLGWRPEFRWGRLARMGRAPRRRARRRAPRDAAARPFLADPVREDGAGRLSGRDAVAAARLTPEPIRLARRLSSRCACWLTILLLRTSLLGATPASAQTDPKCAQGAATRAARRRSRQRDPQITGQGGQNLSEQLAQSGGVICPPANVDPEIRLPTPEAGAHAGHPAARQPRRRSSVQPK